MTDAPTLEELYARWKAAERSKDKVGAMLAYGLFLRALIVQARADAAMRGEP